MAIRAGQILHVANGFVIDRIQTAGPGNLNIPQEKVYELGNYQSVGIVRDTPDLTFNLEALNVDCEIEGLLTGAANPTSDAVGTSYDLSLAKTMDIISPFKSPFGAFTAVKGVAVPNLTLESVSYRYGLRENAGETFSLRGDSIFYIPGSPKQDNYTGNGSTTAFTFTTTPALTYSVSGSTVYALSVSVDGARQFVGADFTNTASGITFNTAPANGAKIRAVYGVAASTSYPQTVHQALNVKPAAVRGKDIDVYYGTATPVGGGVVNKSRTSSVATITTASAHGLIPGDKVAIAITDATFDGSWTALAGTTGTTIVFANTGTDVTSVSTAGTAGKEIEVRWPDVQSVTIDWRLTLEDDYEFGNVYAVAREATDVPDLTGTIEIKPRTIEALFTRLQQITGTSGTQVIGPNSSVTGNLRIVLRNPESAGTSAVTAGSVIKTHYLPGVRFTIPGYEGRVQQKVTQQVTYQSDTGAMYVYRGDRP
jgi:hypothetical protein